MKYVSLHHHSTYSYMDGYALPKDHVARAVQLEMPALALTEHGNVSSHVKLEQAAQAVGIKPIFGLEAYTAPADMRETQNQRKWHMTVLAMDLAGYQNLNQMVTRSWSEGFYRWPTVTGDILRDHHEGLIVLSGCADSLLACSLLGGKGIERGSARQAESVIRRFKGLLGDRYYLECQQFPELERTRKINGWLEEMSKKYKIPLVATADCHYPVGTDNEMQKILHAAGRGSGSVAAAEAGWEYGILLTPPSTDDEIYRRLRDTGLSKRAAQEAIDNTAVIAERCNVVLPKMERVRYPIEQEPDYSEGDDAEDMIRKWMNAGWKFRGLDKMPREKREEYKARAEYELSIMKQKGFLDYFLMQSDAVRACKDNGVGVGPARGSAAASLVCYLLRITEINPMDFPMMMFERFIDLNRNDLPDVDLDFDDEKRDFVRQHMIKRYGADRVGNIGTFTRYRGKNSIDDVARVYEIPKFAAESVKDMIIERSGGDSRFDASLEDTVEQFPAVKETFQKYPKLYNAVPLEGNLRGMGVHAAGLVVGSGPLHEVLATYSRTMDAGTPQERVLQVMSVDKYDGEHLGLLKLDALGLTTMGMIGRATDMIGMELNDLYQVPLTDEKTLAAFEKADVTGIFQFEGRTTRMVTQEVKPRTFMELVDINALSRPGPLHSGSTAEYIAVKWGRQEPEHIHPLVDELTDYTKFQIIYQEQILALCRNMGKFPWVHASAIRKIISQKKGEAAFNELYGRFLDGAAEQGISRETADKTWRRLVTAGTYAFNVAHCVSYATLAFWCMWLKVHHPVAFYAAQLAKTDPNKKDRLVALMRDMQDERYGRSLRVVPPQLDSSEINWSPLPDSSGVQAGLIQIKGIGQKTAEAILDYKKSNTIESWGELIAVKGIGKKTCEMVEDFCGKEDPFGLNFLKDKREECIAEIKAVNRKARRTILPLPDTLAEDVPYEDRKSYHVVLAVVKARNPQDLYENHRSRTGEELDPSTVKDPHLKDSMTLYCEDPSGVMTVKVNRWKYPHVKDKLWGLRLEHDFLLMRVEKKPYFGKTIHVQDLWVLQVDDEETDDEVQD